MLCAMNAQVPSTLQGALPPIAMPCWLRQTSQIEYVPAVQERCQKAVDALAAALPLQIQVCEFMAACLHACLSVHPLLVCVWVRVLACASGGANLYEGCLNSRIVPIHSYAH